MTIQRRKMSVWVIFLNGFAVAKWFDPYQYLICLVWKCINYLNYVWSFIFLRNDSSVYIFRGWDTAIVYKANCSCYLNMIWQHLHKYKCQERKKNSFYLKITCSINAAMSIANSSYIIVSYYLTVWKDIDLLIQCVMMTGVVSGRGTPFLTFIWNFKLVVNKILPMKGHDGRMLSWCRPYF